MDDGDVLKVKRLRPGARLPERATEGSSGLDLFACIEEPGSGVAIELPRGFDVQVRPRSGLSTKGVGVAFGTIDSDYRGEVLVTMYLFGDREEYRVNHGDRIAQLVIVRLADLPLTEVSELSVTARGSGGHGSTGHGHLIATPNPPANPHP
jgi:dUTP pyrophosphatase